MKRVLSILLALTLVFSTISMVSMAETKAKIDLRKAIEIAKEKLQLKTEGYDFNSNYTQAGDVKRWDLNWTSKQGQQTHINASIDADTGELIAMSEWGPYTPPTSRLPKYTREDALKAAVKFAKAMSPDKFKQTKLQNQYPNGIPYDFYSDTYNFSYTRQYGGIAADFNGIYVNIDKNTLKVRSYHLAWDKGVFPDGKKAMVTEKAKKLFEEKLGLELAYHLVQDGTSKDPKVVLVYNLKNGNIPIDAITGDLLHNSYMGPMFSGAAKEAMINSTADAAITPQEQKVIDDLGKFISQEKAIEALKNYLPISDKYTLSHASLNNGYNGENAFWSFSWNYSDTSKELRIAPNYGYIYGAVDAVTGEIRNFQINTSDMNQPGTDKAKLEKAQAKEIAEHFLKTIQPDKFKSTEYRDSLYESPRFENQTSYSFNYIRKANGIACPFNSINVTVNANTGEITSYGLSWSNIKLPAPTGVISLSQAYKNLYSKADFSMRYIKLYDYSGYSEKVDIKLAYVLNNFNMIDAKTGTFVGYNGQPIKELKPATFSDTKGHKAEKDIALLAEMNIIEASTNGKFSPNAKILQKDFIKLLVRSLEPMYYPMYKEAGTTSSSEYEAYYNQAIQRKILTAKDKKPDGFVTREQAAKMVLRAMNLGYAAELSGIYNVSFKDAKAIGKDNVGYAVLANRIGIIPAVNGSFNPATHLTKGDTASVLVRYMKTDMGLKN